MRLKDPRFWPCIKKVTGPGGLGTGILIGPQTLLTANHLAVAGPGSQQQPALVHAAEGQTVSTSEVHTGSCRPGEDISVLRLEKALAGTEPAPLGSNIKETPLNFRTCGYRTLGGGRPKLLWGEGRVLGRDGKGRLQLQTERQIREGMSGAPVVVEIGNHVCVVGVIVEAQTPRNAEEDEGLAFATPVESLPASLREELGVTDFAGASLGEPAQAAAATVRGMYVQTLDDLRRNSWAAVAFGLLTLFEACIAVALLANVGPSWLRLSSAFGQGAANLAIASVVLFESSAALLWYAFTRVATIRRAELTMLLEALSRINSGHADEASELLLAAARQSLFATHDPEDLP